MKNKETLEDFAERLCPNKQVEYDMILEGAKWQQERMYSEEEVSELVDMLQKCKEYFLLKTDLKSEERADAIGQVLEQFKKK